MNRAFTLTNGGDVVLLTALLTGRGWGRGVSPDDGVIGQLAEALAHTRGATQVLLQEVGEDLQHHLIRELLLEVLLCWRCRAHNRIILLVVILHRPFHILRVCAPFRRV